MSLVNMPALVFWAPLLVYSAGSADPRNIRNGWEIPSEDYCDQPYVVVLDDGTWLCTLTTGPGKEGATRQHVVSTRSLDHAKTWEPLTDIEAPGPPESSWAIPLKTPGGRVYAFYDYNADNIRNVSTSDGKKMNRVDTLGHYVFKYSDDGGKSWSTQRYRVPIREFAMDRENVYQGKIQFMWSVAKPLVHNGNVYIGLSKVGNFGKGFIERSEGVILTSDTVLTEKDPNRITWETLPDGDIGLRAPEGPIAEEQHLAALADGSLFCTYRTTQGHPCHAYSRDGGHTWTPPAWMTYVPGGRVFKHPRAANFVRRLSNGKFLYWFHNHGGTSYEGRNPVWMCGGVERDGFIHWSQPEIVLYDEDPAVRMSYPDFIEDHGRVFVAETQKSIARVHEIRPEILKGLWGQFENAHPATKGLVLDVKGRKCAKGATINMPRLPTLSPGTGFALDVLFYTNDISSEQVLLETRENQGNGIALAVTPDGAVALIAGNGLQNQRWESDPGVISPRTAHKVTVIVDGGPRVLLFVIDGVLCDGGTSRPQGWYRLDAGWNDFNGARILKIPPDLHGEIRELRVYNRALRVSEAVANHRLFGASPSSQSDGAHFFHCRNGRCTNSSVTGSKMGGYFLEGCENVMAGGNLIRSNGSRGVTIERDSRFCTLTSSVPTWEPGGNGT